MTKTKRSAAPVAAKKQKKVSSLKVIGGIKVETLNELQDIGEELLEHALHLFAKLYAGEVPNFDNAVNLKLAAIQIDSAIDSLNTILPLNKRIPNR